MKITLLENDSSKLKYIFLIEGISNTLIKKLQNYIKSEILLHPLENLKKEYALSTLDSLRASKYIVTSLKTLEHEENIKALEKLRVALQSDLSKNLNKLIPDVYKRNTTCQLDLKDLKEFLALRDFKSSSYEEKELARLLFKALPKEHRNLLEDEKE